MSNEPETPVVFRWHNHDGVTAYFVAEPFNLSGSISCYAHVGQHGAADYFNAIRHSRPAKPEEYAELQRELESEPYNYRLKIYERQTPQHRAAIRAQVRAWRKGV